MYIFMIQLSLNKKYSLKKRQKKCSHTPWRSSKYARLVLVKTKKRTLKLEGEVLLFCWDFLMSRSSRRMKLFMIQFLKSDAFWASPLSTTRGDSFGARNAMGRQLTLRALFKGNLPPVLSLYQCSVNNWVSPLMSKAITTSFRNAQNSEAYVKNTQIICCMVWKWCLRNLRLKMIWRIGLNPRSSWFSPPNMYVEDNEAWNSKSLESYDLGSSTPAWEHSFYNIKRSKILFFKPL